MKLRTGVALLVGLLAVGISSPQTACAALRQVDLTNTLLSEQPVAVTTVNGRGCIAQRDGRIRMLAGDGQPAIVVGDKDPQGKPLFGRPGGLASYGDQLYVSDEKLGRIVILDRSGKVVASFGQDGDAPKEFDSPRGMAFCRGLLFVADTGNDRVQVLSPEGIYLAAIGTSGPEETRLAAPIQIAIDPQGRLLILEKSGVIKIFKPTGEYEGKLSVKHLAIAIAADNEGLFLADSKNLQICKVDFRGRELFSFGSKGPSASQFLSVSGLSATPQGELLVADMEKNSILIFATEPTPALHHLDLPPALTSVRQQTARPGHFTQLAADTPPRFYAIENDNKKQTIILFEGAAAIKHITFPKWQPIAITLAPDGNLLVLDAKKSQVLKLNPAGEILASFGSSGSGDGCFDEPSDLVASRRGMIYVADQGNRRIQVFNAGGVLLKILQWDDLRPAALALDEEENLYVLDTKQKRITVIDPEGVKGFSFGNRDGEPQLFTQPLDLALTSAGIVVLDEDAVKIFDRKGTFLWRFGAQGSGTGDFNGPSSLLTMGDNDILVNDQQNNRILPFIVDYTPQVPTGLTGQSGPRQISLLWKKNPESYVVNYGVYRKGPEDGDFQLLKQIPALTFTDRGLLPGKTYAYRVTAFSRSGRESTAATAIEVLPDKLVPTPPRELKALALEWSIDLTWSSAPQDPPPSEYRIYRITPDGKRNLLSKTVAPMYYDGNLEAETTYRYAVSSVSPDEVEGEPVELEATTLAATRPPLEIEVVSMDDVFANTYKIYETDGIGKLRITNNTRDNISKVKITFTIKDYMDYPSEFEITDLAPRNSQVIALKAVFNNLLLNLTEDTAVQGELTATFYKNQTQTRFFKNQTIRLFEKHRILWSEPERFSAFVTPKDPVILEFGRSIASQFSEYDDTVLFAGVSFDALGVLGVGYLKDPSNPYQVTSEKTDFVDYLQYPRETLSRKSGDCDDLVSLYSSVLESLGIQTKVVEVPGHMFMIFATQLTRESIPKGFSDMYVEHEGTFWVPVEVTLIGSPFMKAWEAGSQNFKRWQERGLKIMDIRAAWAKYKPASLPMTDWKPQAITKAEIDKRYQDELPTLRKIRLQNLGQIYLTRLQTDPNDSAALLQLGILYARNGEPREALPILEKTCRLLHEDASVYNNLANIYFLLERFDEAAVSYAEAVRLEAGDPYVWVNYARTLARLEKKEEAKRAFEKALAIEPTIKEQYKTLAVSLDTPY